MYINLYVKPLCVEAKILKSKLDLRMKKLLQREPFSKKLYPFIVVSKQTTKFEEDENTL